MALRMTEEEFEAWKRQRQRGCAPRKASAAPAEAGRKREDTAYEAAAAAVIQGASPVRGPAGPATELPEGREEAPKRRSKYGNRKVELDGKKFDSQHEAAVYQELMLRVRAGELKCVCRQVPFDLPGGIQYIADFVTVGPDLRIEVIDAKSEATKKNAVYVIKKKQMLDCWGIAIREL